jgi:AbrB family looped-hinge helix DNA binding protein
MAKILGASKVTVRYQVTIPENVRKLMKIEVGQTLVFTEENGKVILKTEL